MGQMKVRELAGSLNHGTIPAGRHIVGSGTTLAASAAFQPIVADTA
jgi:hypothetical protein